MMGIKTLIGSLAVAAGLGVGVANLLAPADLLGKRAPDASFRVSGEMREVNGVEYWAPDDWCDMLWAEVLVASETGYYAVEEEYYTSEQILLLYNEWRFDAEDHCLHRKSTTDGPNYKNLFGIDFDWFDKGDSQSGDFLCDRNGNGLDSDDILWYCALSMHANDARTWTVEDIIGLLKIFAVEWLDSSECLDGDPSQMNPEGLLLCDAAHRIIQSRFSRRMAYWELADLLEASGLSGRACDMLPGDLPYSKGNAQQFLVDRDGDTDRDLDDLLLFMAESELCARAEDPPYVYSDADRLTLILHWLNQPWLAASEIMCWEYVNWAEHVFMRVLTPDEVGDILGAVSCNGDYRDPRSGGWRPPGEGAWSERLPTCEPCIGEFPPIAPGGGNGGGEGSPRSYPPNDNNNIYQHIPQPVPPDQPDSGGLEGPLMVGLGNGRGQILLPGPGTPGWNDPPQDPPTENGDEGLLMILPPPGWHEWVDEQTPPGDMCDGPLMVPVDPVYGHKMESITDLRVQVPGPDFYLIRSYSSDPASNQAQPSGGAGMVGENWSLNLFHALRRVGDSDPHDLEIDAGQGRRIRFHWNGTAEKWLPNGASAQFITSDNDLYTLTEPGSWEIDFYNDDQSPFDLLIKERRDPYGNKHVYDWRADFNGKEYLQAIHLNGTSPANADATVQITYDADADMRVKSVRVIRRTSGGQYYETQRVSYTYFTEESGFHDAIGTEGDLVQVVHRQLVDRSATNAPAYREWVTQYRYHGGLANETSDDPGSGGDGDGFLEKGDAHQLKAIILPEQIEWFVQQRFKDNPAELGVVSVEAAHLLTMADANQLFSTIRDETVMNLAAKVIAEYETTGDKRVKVQHVQAACGCAGTSAESVRYEYAYLSGTAGLIEWKTTRIDQLTYDEGQSAYVLYRRYYYDAEEMSGGTYYVVNRVTEQSGATPERWVKHLEFTGASRHLTKIIMPSAMASYTPSAAGSPDTKWSYAASTTDGLVYEYVINSAHRVESFGVREGNGSNTLEKIWEFTWGTGNEDHLVTSAKFYRVAGSAQADDIELITLDYGFHSGRALAWTELTIEAGLVSENGPGGSLTIYRLFDTEGNLVWRKAADDRMDRFAFDASTGLIVTAEYNADKTDKPDGGAYSSIPNYASWSDRHADGDSLTYTMTYDLLGRPHKVTTPSGVSKHFVRELITDESGERPGILHPVEFGLPHILSGGSTPVADGPIVARWRTASGTVFRESEFTVGPDPDYHTQNGAVTAFTPGDELARATVQQGRNGLVESERRWHDLSRDAFHETGYVYDALGRLEDTISVTGTITRHQYDVLDRLTAIQTGTSDVNLETIVEFFYDHQILSQQPVSKPGDGNLTFIRQHTGEMSGQDEIVRDTILAYDYRNRAVKVERPEKPHVFIEYDNLDRAVRSALNSNPAGTSVESNLSTRGLYTETAYNQRGLPYRTRVVIDPTQSSSLRFLETHRWFDETGRVVGAWAPNSPGMKATYDGLGRVTSTYITDRRGDAAPGASGNHADVHAAHASVLTGDVVLEQHTTRYITSGTDHRGLPDLNTTWVRTHDASTSITGALSALSGGDAKYAIATFHALYYDAADRVIRTANFGTNQAGFKSGGTSPTINQSSPPVWNTGDQLVTALSYNARGLVDTITDPQNIVTRIIHDDLARTIATIDAYVDATVSWSDTLNRWEAANLNDDADRVISIVYDLENRLIKQVAHLPGDEDEAVQVTEYHFGVTKGAGAGDSLVASNDLLRKIVFPDREMGETEPDYTLFLSYNRLGEPRYRKDQNKTEHFFTRDKLGRLTLDKVSIPGGSTVDATINALGYTFDDFGRLEFARSYTDHGGGGQAVVNAVKFTYTPLWQVARFWQAPEGDVVTSGGGESLHVSPTYSNAGVDSGNYSRLADIQYPDGNKIGYTYGDSGSVNNIISRLHRIRNGTGGGAPVIASYDHIGLSGFAGVSYDWINVNLTYKLRHNGSNPEGEYGGLDRFGRIARHAWTDAGFGAHASSSAVPSIPPIVELAYGHDRVGNVLSAYDARPGTAQERSHEYDYDPLRRLKEAERGLWDGSTFTKKADSQRFTQDILNNFRRIETDADGLNGYETDEIENRNHFTDANELLGRDTDNDDDDDIEIDYDFNGNLIRIDPTPGGGTRIIHYRYDAWNRLAAIDHEEEESAHPVAVYRYNALHQRVLMRVDHDPDDSTHTLNQQRVLYYSPMWQVLEERIDDDWSAESSAVDRHVQHIWGVLHIDDIILHREDGNADGDYDDEADRIWHHLTDPQFSTVAILDLAAAVVERVSYDVWGQPRHHPRCDFDGDGDFDKSDADALDALILSGPVLITDAGYRPEMDLDRDGDVDAFDQALRGTVYIAALPKGALSSTGVDGVDNTVGWSGYRYDQPVRLYSVRFRFYDPVMFRWLNRDPAGYVDSMNLYGYGWGNPVGWFDPFGLGGPFFAAGAYIDREGFIGYDSTRYMSWWQRERAWFWDTLGETLMNLPGALASQILEELTDPLTWILLAIPSGGLLKPLLKGPGRTLIKHLFRSGRGVRPGLGTKAIRFFYDNRSWKSISSQYWRKRGGATVIRNGRPVRLSRDHWIISERFAKKYPWILPWAHGYWNSGLVIPLRLNIFFYHHPWARGLLWGGAGTAGGAGFGGGYMLGDWAYCER